MRRLFLALWVCGAISGCGSSSSGQDVKSPEERIAEQERLAYEAEQNKLKREKDEGNTPPPDEESQQKDFDKKQAQMELQRATRSAESCTGVVKEAKERGEATVVILFTNDGSVKDATISVPFEGTALGSCILNAYKAVIVPPFQGSEKTINWELTLQDPPKDDDAPPPTTTKSTTTKSSTKSTTKSAAKKSE